ncbi:MAG: hypothetical protein IJ489_09070 [Clostridia bacterium]|nr:hypothetical protein [Clostridia bacterium]
MKKFIIFVWITILMFSLSSCTVNWGGEQYQVPWQMIIFPMIFILTVIFLVVWIAVGKHIAKETYVCQNCNQKFHPKWQSAGFSVHMGNDRILKCPHCRTKGFCPPSHDSKE